MPVSVSYVEKEEFEKWRRGLDNRIRARVDRAITRLERGSFDNLNTMGDVKSLKGGIYELRIPEGAGYRIYFMRKGNDALILKAGTKRTQEADIHVARRRKKSYEAGLRKRRLRS